MNNLNFIHFVEVDRHKDLLEKSEKQRLTHQLTQTVKPGNTRTRHIMITLGNKLISLGNWLQKRYTDLPVAYPTVPLTKSQAGEC